MAIVTLILTPILTALGVIQTRQLREMHEYTVNFYAITTAALIFGITLLVSGEGLTFYQYFDSCDYVLLAVVSIAGASSVTTRTLSLKYGQASSTSILSYLIVVILLIVDVFLFGTQFSTY